MVIVGKSLKSLNQQFSIVNRNLNSPVEDFAINLFMDKSIKRYKKTNRTILYGTKLSHHIFEKHSIRGTYISMKPYTCVLACSSEIVNIPQGYFGLVQTKGSLARLFVSVTCCDGQIEPGFNGKVTFEISNLNPNIISIPFDVAIAQLYIFRCSTRNTPVYHGRYQGSNEPTEPRF